MWPFNIKEIVKISISEFSALNNFCPYAYFSVQFIPCIQDQQNIKEIRPGIENLVIRVQYINNFLTNLGCPKKGEFLSKRQLPSCRGKIYVHNNL